MQIFTENLDWYHADQLLTIKRHTLLRGCGYVSSASMHIYKHRKYVFYHVSIIYILFVGEMEGGEGTPRCQHPSVWNLGQADNAKKIGWAVTQQELSTFHLYNHHAATKTTKEVFYDIGHHNSQKNLHSKLTSNSRHLPVASSTIHSSYIVRGAAEHEQSDPLPITTWEDGTGYFLALTTVPLGHLVEHKYKSHAVWGPRVLWTCTCMFHSAILPQACLNSSYKLTTCSAGGCL